MSLSKNEAEPARLGLGSVVAYDTLEPAGQLGVCSWPGGTSGTPFSEEAVVCGRLRMLSSRGQEKEDRLGRYCVAEARQGDTGCR